MPNEEGFISADEFCPDCKHLLECCTCFEDMIAAIDAELNRRAENDA